MPENDFLAFFLSTMLIDTHAHLNFNAYEHDADEVIRRSLAGSAHSTTSGQVGSPQVTWMINVGSQYSTSKRAVELAGKYFQGVYAAIGLHPIHLETGLVKIKIDPAEFSSGTHGAGLEGIQFKTFEENFDYEKYKELVKSPKVVAIGEIGLDYWYRPKTKVKQEQFKNKQKEIFIRQLELARELNLPVILHCRLAHDDLITTLQQYNITTIRGVIHCFTGTWEQAKRYMELGFYIGFNGIIFKLDLDEIIKKTPLEKILVETDCPYLTPPQEGNKRNEPIFVQYIAQKISEIKGISYDEVAKITTGNARELFKV